MPKFDYASPEGRLDTTDANFVDVIHSCAGTLGIKKSIGHIDFYPNNGEGKTFYCLIHFLRQLQSSAIQPGCTGVKEFTGCIIEYYFITI